jgi:hypothetical protein
LSRTIIERPRPENWPAAEGLDPTLTDIGKRSARVTDVYQRCDHELALKSNQQPGDYNGLCSYPARDGTGYCRLHQPKHPEPMSARRIRYKDGRPAAPRQRPQDRADGDAGIKAGLGHPPAVQGVQIDLTDSEQCHDEA